MSLRGNLRAKSASPMPLLGYMSGEEKQDPRTPQIGRGKSAGGKEYEVRKCLGKGNASCARGSVVKAQKGRALDYVSNVCRGVSAN